MNALPNPGKTIGLILTTTSTSYEGAIWKSFVTSAKAQNTNVMTFTIGHSRSRDAIFDMRMKILDLKIRRHIDGLIISSASISSICSESEILSLFQKFSSIPCLSIGTDFNDIPSLMVDNQAGMTESINHLIEDHGYTRIGYIRGPSTNPEAEIRFDCYRRVLNDHDLIFEERRVLQSDFFIYSSITGEEDPVQAYLQNNQDLQAIVCSNDELAFSFLERLKKAGISVPDQIAVTGFDDVETSACIVPPLTTVHQPLDKLGEFAFDIMSNMLEGLQVPQKTVLPCHVVIRRSCGCFPYSSAGHDLGRRRYLLKDRGENPFFPILEKHLRRRVPRQLWESWAKDLHEAWRQGSENQEGFLKTLERIVNQGGESHVPFAFWQEMMFHIKKHLDEDSLTSSSDLFESSTLLIAHLAQNKEQYRHADFKFEFESQYIISQYLLAAVDRQELIQLSKKYLPRAGFPSHYIVLYVDSDTSELMMANDPGSEENSRLEACRFSRDLLLPESLDLFPECRSYFISALFNSDRLIGHILLETGHVSGGIYGNYTIQFSHIIRSLLLLEDIRTNSDLLENTVVERTAELRQANQQLKKLDGIKNDFIANMTHEFRSPLTVIMNTADFALHYPHESADSRESFALIHDSALKLKATIDQLLDLAKLDSQAMSLDTQKIHLPAFLDNIVDYFSSAVLQQNISFVKDFHSDTPELLSTDPQKLAQILNNILSNAVKFVEPGEGRIEVLLRQESEHALIIVKDNGIGIAQEDLPRIFDRFEQVQRGRSSRYGGTGIGLAFCKQLVQLMKGEIWAESQGLGRGSAFFLRLPRSVSDEIGQDMPLEIEARVSLGPSSSLSGHSISLDSPDQFLELIQDENGENEFDPLKAVILIVDDNFPICEIVMRYLKHGGYRNFVLTNNPRKGLEAVYAYHPHIVISDYNMPGMNGDEFHDEILSNPDFRKLPFVFLSAVHDSHIISTRRKKGASAYLRKPIDGDDLVLTVTWHLKNHFEYIRTLKLASVDELTEIHNHRSILKRLHEELSKRQFNDLSLVFFDIDFFKSVNDEYGHQTGDRILKAMGQVLKTSLREYDHAGRYGGDEFLIILPESNIHQARVVAETLSRKVKNMVFDAKDTKFSVTLSMGVVSLKDHAAWLQEHIGLDDLRELFDISRTKDMDWFWLKTKKRELAVSLIEASDRAMYKAKESQCRACGFVSTKKGDFSDHRCSSCGSTDIHLGRNRIVDFQ